ncbi:MAG: hypothetical protein ABI114_08865 [Rhodanobacter sp.]
MAYFDHNSNARDGMHAMLVMVLMDPLALPYFRKALTRPTF